MPANGEYGASLRLLYGDWDWYDDFGLSNGVGKHYVFVNEVAFLAARCFVDPVCGRIHAGFFSKRGDESDSAFFERILGDLLHVRSAFANVHRYYFSLLAKNVPFSVETLSIDQKLELQSNLNYAFSAFLDRVAHKTLGVGWVIDRMQFFDDAAEQYKKKTILAHRIAEAYENYPTEDTLEWIIDSLVDETTGALAAYGEFFSEKKKLTLAGLVDEVTKYRGTHGSRDYATTANGLKELATSLRNSAGNIWDRGSLVRKFAIYLNMVFTGFDNESLLRDSFTEQSVLAKIEKCKSDTECGVEPDPED